MISRIQKLSAIIVDPVNVSFKFTRCVQKLENNGTISLFFSFPDKKQHKHSPLKVYLFVSEHLVIISQKVAPIYGGLNWIFQTSHLV